MNNNGSGSGLPVAIDTGIAPLTIGGGDSVSTRIATFEMMVKIGARLPPRDPVALMKVAAAIGDRMGEDGYYSFPMGGDTIEGPSIDLMEALREPWGVTAVMCRIAALSGQNVLLEAEVFDGRSGNLTERPNMFTLSNPPAKFAEKLEQQNRWRAMQVQSAVSKAVRGALEHALPAWYVNVAFRAALKSAASKLATGPELEEALVKVTDAFAERAGVTIDELVEWLGIDRQHWGGREGKRIKALLNHFFNGEESPSVDDFFAPYRAKIAARKAGPLKEDGSPAAAAEAVAPAAGAPLGLPAPTETASAALGLNTKAPVGEPVPSRRRAAAQAQHEPKDQTEK